MTDEMPNPCSAYTIVQILLIINRLISRCHSAGKPDKFFVNSDDQVDWKMGILLENSFFEATKKMLKRRSFQEQTELKAVFLYIHEDLQPHGT